MCVIIDTNVAQRVLCTTDDPDYGDLHSRLFAANRNQICLVYGGQLLREYVRSSVIIHLIRLLDQTGRARAISDSLVDSETQRVIAEGLCISNDEHIIALARVSGVRVLCTNDACLQDDFRNPLLVRKPRGKIYSRKSHKRMLNHACR